MAESSFDEQHHDDTEQPGNIPEFSVSELSFALKRAVEDRFGYVRVRGELSGVKRAASGHVYMALKDDKAVLDAVCWRGTAGRLRFKPEDGLEVVAAGRLTTYPGRSKYQLIVEQMAPAGVGALMALLEERRKKLAAEGLFDAERKQPLPYLPAVIGVVTSPTGAVIRDILHRLRDRFPRHVVVWPVIVQGDKAAQEIANAISGFAAIDDPNGPVPRPDLLIVARGGGSIEDLWAFNEEAVVRAVAACPIPVISAVGHETDTTLLDFVADQRAPTPTAAAELAVPVWADLADSVDGQGRRLKIALRRHVQEAGRRLQGAARGLNRGREQIPLARQRVDDASERLRHGLMNRVRLSRSRYTAATAALRPQLLKQDLIRHLRELDNFTGRLHRAGNRAVRDATKRLQQLDQLLQSYSYRGVLKRGYAVVRDQNGAPIAGAVHAPTGARIEIEWHDGRREGFLGDAMNEGLRSRKPAGRAKSVKPSTNANKQQGHLFDD